MNKETLQKSLSLKAWKQVVAVAGPKDEYVPLQKEDVRCLVEILNLAKLRELSKYILVLLDLIRERCKEKKVKKNYTTPHSPIHPQTVINHKN